MRWKRFSGMDPNVCRDGHLYVHDLGVAAYDPERDLGGIVNRTLRVVPRSCYHDGVIHAFFAAAGDIAIRHVLYQPSRPTHDGRTRSLTQAFHPSSTRRRQKA